ncbi:hypothetical protein B0J11DRAFT_511983 [Dendryphion nanum]|uniref:F-box domain-containing protein n=1 Tax=Dendryphion nanum TaxID=256645 RepID=A0A9P9D4B9_9PLEO|nr:hypothetical protein B0J11DRAFT_511983 [Dendryphion nanum]
MSPFSRLPMDIFPFIFDHLSCRDYYVLVRVCRSFHEKVLPYVYKHISFEVTKSRRSARRLAFLLRTLFEQPHLANHVTTFKLLGPHPCWSQYNPWPEDIGTSPIAMWGLENCNTLSKAQKIFASNQFYQLLDPDVHKSLAQDRGRCKDALASLILTRFTQLTSLELGDGFLMYSLFLPHIIKKAPSFFPQLQHIHFGDQRMDLENSLSYVDLDLIRPILYLPTAKSFAWRMTQPWQFRWKEAAPQNRNLTSLHLFRTNISRPLLGEILSTTPNLKRLCYEQEILFRSNMTQQQKGQLSLYTSLDELGHALQRVQGTLEELKLSFKLAPGSSPRKDIGDKNSSFPPIQGTLTALRDMKRLRKIDIPMIMILGWYPDFAPRLEEVMPSAVKHFTLSDDFVSFCPWVQGFSCFKKIGLIGEYLLNREIHAQELRELKLKLTMPRVNLCHD